MPDDGTPWERIVEFRNDPDSKSRLYSLRRWISRSATAATPARELAEELEYLLHIYDEHMRLHFKATSRCLTEILVVGAAPGR